MTFHDIGEWIPSQEAVDWCIVQQISNNNVLALDGLLMFGIAYLFLEISFWLIGTKFDKYSISLVRGARTMLLISIVYYILVVHMQLY